MYSNQLISRRYGIDNIYPIHYGEIHDVKHKNHTKRKLRILSANMAIMT